MRDESFVPFHVAAIGDEEIEAVAQVLKSCWLTTGPKAQQLESKFADYVGAKHAVAVQSGTAALQLAVDAIGLQPGDEVLVPTYTFTATAAVVAHVNAVPVLCDSIAGEFNVDPAALAARITSRTRAIIPVHIAGSPCDLAAIQSIADQHGLKVVEDAAHALPAYYRGRKIGGISELTAFSFYATKTMTTGEGGMLTTNNPAHAARAAGMRLHGISGDAWKRYAREGSWFYEVVDAGYKLNLCDILAAIGLVQLRKCDSLRQLRQNVAERYRCSFAEIPELELPPVGDDPASHAWHLFILRIRPKHLTIGRNDFIEELKKLGIGTSVHFIPLHLHPFYQNCYGYRSGDFPNAEDAFSRAISLPLFPDMSEAAQERVTNAVQTVVDKNRKRLYAVAA